MALCHEGQGLQARIRDFDQGGQRSFDPRGALSSKFSQNRGFPLKLPENCMILKKKKKKKNQKNIVLISELSVEFAKGVIFILMHEQPRFCRGL